jgi:hypothetical protein
MCAERSTSSHSVTPLLSMYPWRNHQKNKQRPYTSLFHLKGHSKILLRGVSWFLLLYMRHHSVAPQLSLPQCSSFILLAIMTGEKVKLEGLERWLRPRGRYSGFLCLA